MREHIVIAGGGIAAVEAVAALRALAGPLPRITVLTPEPELPQRAGSVGAPFGFGTPGPLPLAEAARRAPFTLLDRTLAAVQPEAHVVVAGDGARIGYDALVVAVGAKPHPAVEGAIAFTGPADADAVASAAGEARRIAFVQPHASTWSLPIYELALMAAVEHPRTAVTVVTAEPAPLSVFGEPASHAVAALLSERGIALRAGVKAVRTLPGELLLADGETVPADRVVALPRLLGPAIAGLPHDEEGFIRVDEHGRVRGVADVFAAGDAVAFPLKQGGLAAQQADAVASVIAERLGAPVVADPFRPVLRGLLLTGGAPLYLRAEIGGGPGVVRRLPATAVSRRPLWWPPGKVAGRYIAPLLATARPPVLAAAPLRDLPEPPPGGEHGDALELALLLAQQDAAVGDYRQAVQALDAAAALTGRTLPGEWAERREAWLAGHPA
jgi:sulfide:quinone oxidoreductase